MLFDSVYMTFRKRKAAQLFRVKGKRDEKVNARRVGAVELLLATQAGS